MGRRFLESRLAPVLAVFVWAPASVAGQPPGVRVTNFLDVGSSDVGGGQAGLLELDVSQPDPGPSRKSVVLETAPVVIGAPSLDIGVNPSMIYVGSVSGVFYAVEASF